MRLCPLDGAGDDAAWIGNPGYPAIEGSWLRPTLLGLPEYVFEEGHDKNKNLPPPRILVGTHEDAHIRVDDPQVPRRQCVFFKEGHGWFLERLSPRGELQLNGQQLEPGLPQQLASGDLCLLLSSPRLAYRVEFDPADNWYLNTNSEKDFPNRWPAPMPGHVTEAPPVPEELKRLAWQTDQMRRRSEEDQVRVADWAAFSQYVKKHYHKYGIFAQPWQGSLGPASPPPPQPGPRTLPDWVAQLLSEERMLPHVARDLPFRSALDLSGLTLPQEPALQPLPQPARAPPSPSARTFGVGTAEARQRGVKAGSFQQWLESMQDSQFVLQYHDALVTQFDSLDQLLDLYVQDGLVDERFFDIAGITKLGHRRIFQKWFRDHA
ncbi:unnamed protein product [Effrenium voratum]|nr:unnamed protein product [Effrenium voratum]